MGGSNPQVKSKEMIAQDSTSAKSTAKSKDESQSPRSKRSGSTVSRATKPPPICDHTPPQELYALKDTGNYLDHQLERKTYENHPYLVTHYNAIIRSLGLSRAVSCRDTSGI